MPQALDQIDRLRIAAPCPTTWESMAGDERVRHCTLCSLNVYNFAEMTRDEAREVLLRSEGRVCVRLYRRADGTVLTRDCPTGLRALRRRASRIAAALVTGLLSLASLACGGTWRTPRTKGPGSTVKVQIERVATPQPATFDGVVRDVTDTPLPGVTVVLRDEASNAEITAITDVNGAFRIASLNDGIYRVEVTLDGLRPAMMERLQLKASEVTHASVTLRFNVATEWIVVGAAAPDWRDDMSISTTFSQDFINKMPH